jgi:hypothetical protein
VIIYDYQLYKSKFNNFTKMMKIVMFLFLVTRKTMPPHIVLNPHLQSSYFIFRYTTIFVGMLFPTSVRIVQRPIIINNTFAVKKKLMYLLCNLLYIRFLNTKKTEFTKCRLLKESCCNLAV